MSIDHIALFSRDLAVLFFSPEGIQIEITIYIHEAGNQSKGDESGAGI
jgi:hypothetical protein